jgi:alkylglycerol monooxygenase
LKEQSRVNMRYRFRNYLNIQLAACIIPLFWLILTYEYRSAAHCISVALFIFLTLIICGAMLEQRKWVHYLEAIRILFLIGCMGYYAHSIQTGIVFGSIFMFTLIIFPVHEWYYRFMFRRDQPLDA